jgi:hypothetical protein
MRLLGYQIIDPDTNDMPDDFSSYDLVTDMDVLSDFFQEYVDLHEDCPFVAKPVFAN